MQGNTPYDGRFVFVRLRYNAASAASADAWRGGVPVVARLSARRGALHEDPQGDHATSHPRLDGSNILALDDPELFNYPVAYMAEPGFWSLTDKEAESFRALPEEGRLRDLRRLPRHEGHWDNLQDADAAGAAGGALDRDRRRQRSRSGTRSSRSRIRRRSRRVRSTPAEPACRRYWGIFEDNDPAKRLIAIANVNGDISEYWEFSDTGFAPVDLDNEAYKFGVNYVIYGLTTEVAARLDWSLPVQLEAVLNPPHRHHRPRLAGRRRACRPHEERPRPDRHRAAQG